MVEHPAILGRAARFLAVLCPDWPVVSWGIPLDEPAAVFVANRVIGCSPAARADGVRIGQRRRDAQGRCPDLAVLDRDVDREARLFEPIAASLGDLTPQVEVAVPGLVGFPTRGPSRFFGGDTALAHRVLEITGSVVAGHGRVFVGVADGVFAARLAARTAAEGEVDTPVVVPDGDSAEFVSGFGVGVLDRPALVDVLERLGLRTLGQFAALPAGDVAGRFGLEGTVAHRLAAGLDEYPPDLRRPATDLSVTWWFDPPVDRIDRCAFAAKVLADRLHDTLDRHGLACVRVAIECQTEEGEEFSRLWRHEGALSATALAERARWQLDGWLQHARRTRARSGDDPDGGIGSAITRLTLIPDEVVAATGRQLRFWGGRAERADDVARTIARLQGMLGADSVQVPEWTGGRGPTERVRLVSAAAVSPGEPRDGADPQRITEPWPGRIPPPSPSELEPIVPDVELLDDHGLPARVSARGEMPQPPALLMIEGIGHAITRWSGPWPADERWWDPASHRRRARLQVVTEDQSAYLLVVEQRRWSIEARY